MTEDGMILRIMDVNFNRAKEGLRVVEDFFRFTGTNTNLRHAIRKQRHALNCIAKNKLFYRMLTYRNARGDIGKNVDSFELRAKTASQILYSNFARVKESLRVLEEFSKVIAPNLVPEIKKIRFTLYTLEQKTFLTRKTPAKRRFAPERSEGHHRNEHSEFR